MATNLDTAMFTRCPNCKHPQELTVDQLRTTRAISWCPECATHFDALEQLSDSQPLSDSYLAETEPATPPLNQNIGIAQKGLIRRDRTKLKQGPISERYRLDRTNGPNILPWEAAPQESSPYWRYGVLAGLLLLVAQLLYFHSNDISQNRTLRRFCQTIGCSLPIYHNADELAILSSSLEPLPDHSQLFQALIVNQAVFEQAYPNIELTLLDFAGNAIARRRFAPKDYLLDPGMTIQAEATAKLSLHIAPTTLTVGGYTFDLTYH